MGLKQWIWNPPLEGPIFRSTIFDATAMASSAHPEGSGGTAKGDQLGPELMQSVAPDLGATALIASPDIVADLPPAASSQDIQP